MTKKDSILVKTDPVDHGAATTRQNVAPPPPVNVTPAPSYGVAGSSTPVHNRALAVLNIRSTRN